MAKYSRHDPRNKNNSKNKRYSSDRDFKIRDFDESNTNQHKKILREIRYEDNYYDDEDYRDQLLNE